MVRRDDVEVDLSSVKHTIEPLGPVGELDGLSMTDNHLSDLLQCRLKTPPFRSDRIKYPTN